MPVLVVPVGVVALVQPQTEYVSSSAVWVTSLTDIEASALAPNPNPWLTPAEAQAMVMNDLLRTRSFSAAVASRVGADGPGAYVAVQRALEVRADGTNLMRIVATTGSPSVSQALADAVVTEYQQRVTTEAERNTQIATDYFDAQLGVAQKELDRRKAELAAYLVVNPINTERPTVDLNYLALSGAVESQQKAIEGLLNALDEVRRQAATTQQSLEAHFSVRDQASLPTGPEPVSLMTRVGFPAGGALLGLSVGVAYLYFAFRTDHAVRSREEVRDIGVQVLGVVPVMRRQRNRARATWLSGLFRLPWRLSPRRGSAAGGRP